MNSPSDSQGRVIIKYIEFSKFFLKYYGNGGWVFNPPTALKVLYLLSLQPFVY
jgi:hypothetical protein